MRSRMWGWWLVMVVPGLAAGADTDLGGTGCAELRGLPRTIGVSWQDDIKPLFDTNYPTGRCTGCHNDIQLSGGLDLTGYGGNDAIYRLVPQYAVPGDPRASILFDKLACEEPGWGGGRMPFGQMPLTVEELGLVYDWIAQGTQGQGEDGPEVEREFLFRDGVESLRF